MLSIGLVWQAQHTSECSLHFDMFIDGDAQHVVRVFVVRSGMTKYKRAFYHTAERQKKNSRNEHGGKPQIMKTVK